MKTRLAGIALALALAAFFACKGKQETLPAPETPSPAPAAQETTPAEKTYELRGRIVSRDPAKGTLTVEHERIEGLWEAMTMGFEVRGGDLASLPPDGTRIRATLHVEGQRNWLTDVRPE